METDVSRKFITRLTDIFRLSDVTPWQTSLRQVLALFAEVGNTRDAALVLLDGDPALPSCLALDPASELCATIPANPSLWLDDLKKSSCITFSLPAYEMPVWLWSIPPQSEHPKAVMALAHLDAEDSRVILDQGSALLTPLIDNITRRRAAEDTRTAELGGSIILNQEQRRKYLESLYELIFTINSARDLDEILRTGLAQATQITNLTRGCICLPDRGKAFVLRVYQGFVSEDAADATTDQAGFKRAIEEKRMIVTHLPSAAAGDLQTDVYLPLIVEDEIVGLMRLSAAEAREVTPEASQLLVAIADQLALAVERGQLTDKMREQLQTMRYLYEISTAFLSQMASSGIAFLLLRALTDTISGALGTAFYQHEHGEWRRWRVYAMQDSKVRMHWLEGVPWSGEGELLSATQREGIVAFTDSQPGKAAKFWEHVAAVDGHQLVYFPLFLPDHNFSGAVAVVMDKERALTANESILAWAIIQQGTAALVRVGLYEESRQRESLLRAILESSRDGIILVSAEQGASDILYINGQALKVLALPGDTTVWEDRTLAEVVAAARENVPQLAEWFDKTCEYADASETDEERQKPPDFKTAQGLTLQVQHWAVQSEVGRPMGALFLFRDVTEAKALERMRDDLLNMLVHDMRSPLSATQYSLHLLQDPAMEDVSDKIIKIAINGTERLTSLVDTILQIGRLEAGRFELHQQAVILADHVAEVTKNTLVSADHITLEVDVPYDLSFLWVDPNVVTRVFENLLTNALKFVPKGNGLIRISATQEGDWVTTEIYNNGPHIPPETQKQLFEKFAAGQYKARGFGLGLAFCRLAVEAHGGNIWAQNQPDGGVSFYFTLPVWEDPDADDDLL